MNSELKLWIKTTIGHYEAAIAQNKDLGGRPLVVENLMGYRSALVDILNTAETLDRIAGPEKLGRIESLKAWLKPEIVLTQHKESKYKRRDTYTGYRLAEQQADFRAALIRVQSKINLMERTE